MRRASPRLPFWRLLERAGMSRAAAINRVGAGALGRAELRCVLCGRRGSCAPHLPAEGIPGGCPNALLLAELI